MASSDAWIIPSSQRFFYGRITRDEAEFILKAQGATEGLYLLRESIAILGNYTISICHDGNVHHYSIEKRDDGMFQIADGKTFIGPVELIHHHQTCLDGFITEPRKECNRMPNQPPIAFRGMTYTDLENALLTKAQQLKIPAQKIYGSQRQHLILMVAKDLHVNQPWFHKKISRDEAHKRILADPEKQDGKFLVRVRDDKKTFALTLIYRDDPRHYMIEKRGDKMGIPDGPKFDCIIMLVDHYHNKPDGLLCKLRLPCVAPNFDKRKLKKYMDSSPDSTVYGSVRNSQAASSMDSPRRPSLPIPQSPTANTGPQRHGSLTRPLPGLPTQHDDAPPSFPAPTPPVPSRKLMQEWEEPAAANSRRKKLDMDARELEDIYGSLPFSQETFDLRRSQIDLEENELGHGQFGSVRKGVCTMNSKKKVPVAIKILKNEDISGQEEMMKEARLMSELSNPHVIRMIGVCKCENIMLVLELAPLGPLNSFLSAHKTFPQKTIVELMLQVAKGMTFLSSKNFIHRDLAARNVLLCDEHTAKISDFGMSKAVGRDGNYYEAKEAGRWPLKWYAPECVYYWKFDSKSDVWSYGVTLWEATSYGEKPYRKMKGQQILDFIEKDKRLAKPPECDDEVYLVMMDCWKYQKAERPAFADIVRKMEYQFKRLSHIS